MSKSANVSPHLTWAELACRDGTPYPPEWEERARELAKAFEWIRTLYGGPIRINSAYRTESYNRSIGGARNSQHVQGRALDLCPLNQNGLQTLQNAARAAQDVGLVRGVGLYAGFVHIDTRAGTRATWYGSRGPIK